MTQTEQVLIAHHKDDRVIQIVASVLRDNDGYARQVRDFAETVNEGKLPRGIQFEPKPGQLLIAHFGLGFEKPEIVKTRPVLVISPKKHSWDGLCTVVPISSQKPDKIMPHHYKLPKGLVPSKKYEDAWIKGDLVQTIGRKRMDRFKVGFRDFRAPEVPAYVLKEARRCVLHATGMHSLTAHW